MQLNQIQSVLEVSRCGSFSKAAQNLYISQPSLSQQILALESELKVALFVRHQRGVSLTDAGREFAAYAARIVNEVNSLTSSMHSFAALAKGNLKLGVLWIFADLGLPQIMSRFQHQHWEIKTQITVNSSVTLLEMLRTREVDAIFFIGQDHDVQDPELMAVKVYHSEMMIVTPASHRLAELAQIHITDLEGEDVVMPDRQSSIYAPLMAQLQAYGVVPNVITHSSHTDVLMACAENGIASSFVSRSVAQLRATDRVAVRPLEPVIHRDVYLAVRRDTLIIPAVRLFAQFIQQHYAIQ